MIEREFQKIEDAFGRYNEEVSTAQPEIFISSHHHHSHPNFSRDKFLSINSFGSDDSFKSTRHTNDLDIELRSFETVSDVFYETESVYRNRNQQLITSMKVKTLKKYLKNTLDDRKLFFARKTANHKSLFEEMLRSSAGGSFVNYVWNEFKLFEVPEILTMVINLKNNIKNYF